MTFYDFFLKDFAASGRTCAVAITSAVLSPPGGALIQAERRHDGIGPQLRSLVGWVRPVWFQ